IQRDWGWAPEYVEAMYLMLQQEQPDDYVIATGESSSLEEFVAAAFASVNLDWRNHVVIDNSLLRPTDLAVGKGIQLRRRTSWDGRQKYKMKQVVQNDGGG
ncbi:GDP-mannose 4,6-dehydratase, partial [Nostoc sp. 'Peltigera malacea cyanobiont' DB3992]|uniref:GDP-mannose 4,6-dehydratase n=1 Tax=Nostoc sp. 'Peltigera malacea cyanobiont' DB3992 TaxID=1206980 RepID=UPI0015D4C6BA